MFRSVYLGVAALLISANAAGAQITTYVAPPRPAEAREAIATSDSARRDSVAKATMANMKAWVDSAAGVPVPTTVGTTDSAALANDPGRPVTSFSDGSVAPATASALPAFILLGAASVIVGAALLSTRSRG